MKNDDHISPELVRYGTQVTSADVHALGQFVLQRTRSALKDASAGSVAGQMALGLQMTVKTLTGQLTAYLAVAADPESAWNRLARMLVIDSAWNLLLDAAHPWTHHPTYDKERWQRTKLKESLVMAQIDAATAGDKQALEWLEALWKSIEQPA
ncbi:hypothetical protein ACIREO_22160 [Streptomyces sp. NPDC102441]|uniref:hypothetical protein n=1 Tax=Streptomyces sp. NPDC102441 TaxID=3366176 RepID=UPI00382E77D2